MNLKIIYEDDTLLVIDKPPGIAIEEFPTLGPLGPEYRNGIAHRLDKDTSGVLIIAKSKEMFEFLQQQFQTRNVEKKYLCLATGTFKEKQGAINTLLGRARGDKRKQKGYAPSAPDSQGKREALTLYKVIEEFPGLSADKAGYTLLEVKPKTGRKHQIRAHLTFLNHPLAGDKLYMYKNQEPPEGLKRQFLHASYLKISLPNGETKEFHSPLPKDLAHVLELLRNNKNS